MDGIIKVTGCFYFLVLRKLLFIGCVESNPGPMVKGINYKQNIYEEDTLRAFSLEKLQEENQKLQEEFHKVQEENLKLQEEFQKVQEQIQKLQEDNNKLKKQITLMKSNVPNQETTGRWNNLQDRRIHGLDRELRSGLKNGNWKECVEIIKRNLPADDIVYKQLHAIESYEYLPLAAARKGYVELILVLLCNGLNVNDKIADSNKRTMLHRAAQCGNNNVVELLLSQGADIDARNNAGNTPLHYAAYKGHVSIVKCLIEKGANVNPRDNKNWTPLYISAYYGHISVVQCLLDNNCNRQIKTSSGKTALDIAREKGYSDIVILLDK